MPAAAQDRPFAVSVLGGATLPISGAARDAMGIGWNVGVAGEVRLPSSLAVRADYLYDRYGTVYKLIDVALDPQLPASRQESVRSKSQMHFVSFDLAWSRTTAGGTRVYVMGGPTFFRRRVQLTAANDQGLASACEPQWLQCEAEAIGFDRWLGIKKSDDWGFNAGGGVAFRTGLTALVVVEARYYYVVGPNFTSAAGGSPSASASFLPISVGLRF